MKDRPRGAPADAPGPAAAAGVPSTVAVIAIGAGAIRLVVAEISPGGQIRTLVEASRGILLGKDTFTTGRLAGPTIESALRVLKGYRKVMDEYGVGVCRTVATSAVREAANRDGFVDRVRMRTGLDVEILDGSEESRLTYLAVRAALAGHPVIQGGIALLVEVGGGSAEISLLRAGEPVSGGAYALGAIRMRQQFGAWRGPHDRRIRMLRTRIQIVVDDIGREMPLREATQYIAPGGDARFVAAQFAGEVDPGERVRSVPREAFIAICDQVAGEEADSLARKYDLTPAAAETLVPALLVYRALLERTSATAVTVPEASMTLGVLQDMLPHGPQGGAGEFERQVFASAAILAAKYRCDTPHSRHVAHLAVRLFDELAIDHGLGARDRLLLEIAALLHDAGTYISRRVHHKHSQYILSMSEIFGLSTEDMLVVGNIARYHRRALPQKSHVLYTSLGRETRVSVNKLAAILRVANALDADHLQNVRDLRVAREAEGWALEVSGTGDLTMERHAMAARSDMFVEVFGQELAFREMAESP